MENRPELQQAERFAFGAAADEVLYSIGLAEIEMLKKQKQPVKMVK
jgi:hypothetical protein